MTTFKNFEKISAPFNFSTGCARVNKKLKTKLTATYTDNLAETSDGKTVFGVQNSLGGMFNPSVVEKKIEEGNKNTSSVIVEPDQVFMDPKFDAVTLSSNCYSNGSSKVYSPKHLELGKIVGLEGSEYSVDEDGTIDISIDFYVAPLDSETRSNKGVLPDFVTEEHKIKICYRTLEFDYDSKDYDNEEPNYVSLQGTKKLWPVVPQYLTSNGRGETSSTKDLNNSYSTRVDEFTTTFVRPAEVTATLDFLSSKKYCVVAEVLKIKLLKRLLVNDSYSNLSIKENQSWQAKFNNIEVISRNDFSKKTATPLNKLIQNGTDDDTVVFISQSEVVTVAAWVVLMNSTVLPIELSNTDGKIKHIDGGLCFGKTNMSGKFKIVVEDVNAFNIVLASISQSTYMNSVLIDRIYEFMKECFMIGEADRLSNHIILNIPLQFQHLKNGKNLLSCPKTVMGRLTGGFRVISTDGDTYNINSYKYIVHDVLRYASKETITTQIVECYRDTLLVNSNFSATVDSSIENKKLYYHEKFLENFIDNKKIENFLGNTIGTQTPDVPELISGSLIEIHSKTICNQPLKARNANVSKTKVSFLGGMGLSKMTTNSVGKIVNGFWENKIELKSNSSDIVTDILTRLAWSIFSDKAGKYSPVANNNQYYEFFTMGCPIDLNSVNLGDEIIVANKNKYKVSLAPRLIKSKNRKSSCISGSSIYSTTSNVRGSVFGTNNLKKDTLDLVSVEKLNDELYNSHSLSKVVTKTSKKYTYLISVINILLMTQGTLNRDWYIAIKDNVVVIVGTGFNDEIKNTILRVLEKCFNLSNDPSDLESVNVVFEETFDVSDYYDSDTGYVYYFRDPRKVEPKTKEPTKPSDFKDRKSFVSDELNVGTDDYEPERVEEPDELTEYESDDEDPAKDSEQQLEEKGEENLDYMQPKFRFGKFNKLKEKEKLCICNKHFRLHRRSWVDKPNFTDREKYAVANWYNSLRTCKPIISCFVVGDKKE